MQTGRRPGEVQAGAPVPSRRGESGKLVEREPGETVSPALAPSPDAGRGDSQSLPRVVGGA
jgi:hypothetical protein